MAAETGLLNVTSSWFGLPRVSTRVTARGSVGVGGAMVPAEKVVPGVEVTWTVTANNICKQPSEKVTINNAVPAHMTYVASSATGAGSDITFSLDGKTFGGPAQLKVTENGVARPAHADEYKHIRWVFKAPLAPGANAVARFRAVLN